MHIVTVEQAEAMIRSVVKDYGAETVDQEAALGRVLAEDLLADRDMPPFNRATVDGAAIDYDAYAKGQRIFKMKATQAAGQKPVSIAAPDECVEIMTGAAVDATLDAVVRYEDLAVDEGLVTVKDIPLSRGQNIHRKGQDKAEGSVVASSGRVITPALEGLAASVGKTELLVRRCPRVVIISTGDEMVPASEVPGDYQLRRSNGITIKSVLDRYGICPDILHLNDDFPLIEKELGRCLKEYDVLLVTGGVSMGKFDFIPRALDGLSVKKLFHKVKQRPGKPFWFGAHPGGALVFAFPGNPVSVFMCLHRYFVPWLEKSLGLTDRPHEYAVLQNSVRVAFPLQYFAQVKLQVNEQGVLCANTVDTNGSGDFSNLIYTDGFMEFPLERNEFQAGEVYRIWRYR